jgi:hypothetical protein
LLSSRCYAKPEWRHTLTASYDSNSFWAVTARWRYFEGVDYDGSLTSSKSEGADSIAQGNVSGSESYLDLNATFRFFGDSELLVGVNNVLDEEPPLVGGTLSTNANAIAGFYDTVRVSICSLRPLSASKRRPSRAAVCCEKQSGLHARFFCLARLRYGPSSPAAGSLAVTSGGRR